MNEIILAPCDAGYVQSCTGLIQKYVFKPFYVKFKESGQNDIIHSCS
jgi:hypothetical protein